MFDLPVLGAGAGTGTRTARVDSVPQDGDYVQALISPVADNATVPSLGAELEVNLA